MKQLKLLVIITDRDKSSSISRLLASHGLHFKYALFAMGTATNEMLDYLGIGETKKDIILVFVPSSFISTLMNEIGNYLHIEKPGKGILFTLPLSAASSLLLKQFTLKKEETGENMETNKYELIITLINQGCSDAVMQAARSNGATGGTLIHARSLNHEESTDIFGIKIQAEKEIVALLVKKEAKLPIMEAISRTCGLSSEMHGIIFSLPVDEIRGIK